VHHCAQERDRVGDDHVRDRGRICASERKSSNAGHGRRLVHHDAYRDRWRWRWRRNHLGCGRPRLASVRADAEREYRGDLGVPATHCPGTSRITTKVSDSSGAVAIRTFSLIINPALQKSSDIQQDEKQIRLMATGGAPPYRWEIAGGNELPPGMELNADHGWITRWPGATRDPGSPTGRSATCRTPRWPSHGSRTRTRRPSPPSCAPPARSQRHNQVPDQRHRPPPAPASPLLPDALAPVMDRRWLTDCCAPDPLR
jgi:hypothetical protein